MKKLNKIFTALVIIIIFFTIIFLILMYNGKEKVKIRNAKAETEMISALYLSFRKTYQQIFIDNHIIIDDININLLPVKTTNKINKLFSEKLNFRTSVRTVSDKPRNILNSPNKKEAEIISFFKSNPKEKEYFFAADSLFYYAKPLYITKECLECHGKRENAIPTIKENYDKAYDYKLGELRGIVSIKTSKASTSDDVDKNFVKVVLSMISGIAVFLVIIFFLIKTILKKETEFTENLQKQVKLKTKELKELNNSLNKQNKELVVANKTIFESQEKLRLITTNMNDFVCVISVSGKILYASPSSIKFGGYTPEEGVGYHSSKFFANKKEISKALKLINDFAVKKVSGRFEFLYKAKNKENFPVEVDYSPIIYENKNAAVLVLRNISEQKKAEKEIKEQNEELKAISEELRQNNEELFYKQEIIDENIRKYDLLANNIKDFIWMIDLELVPQYLSPSCFEFTGYKENELEDLKLKDIHPDKSISTLLRIRKEILKKKNVDCEKHFEVEYIHKNGSVFTAEIYAFVVSDSKGEPIGIGGVSRNISEQKKAKEELKKSKEEIEKSHNNTLANIKYAKSIQEALLTPKEIIKKYFKEYFIMFMPKDQVSGDFYYVFKRKNNIVFAVADCTGHGVSGGFLTMLGITFLNDIIRQSKIKTPAQALNVLRNKIKGTFKNFGSENTNGLDIALCSINTKTNILEYAGAYNPLWIIRDDKLIEYPATRNPIGFFAKETDFFNNQIQLQNNDKIYLFSDGFIDQLNGKSYKKYTKKRFRELFLKLHKYNLNVQKEEFENELIKWKGDFEQIDDITIMGINWEIR